MIRCNDFIKCSAFLEPILTIVVHKADQLELDIHVKHPLVRVHIVDMSCGQYFKKSKKYV